MINKKMATMSIFCGLILFTTILAYANVVPPDNMELNTSEYKEHTKGLVVFSHKKHSSNYNIKCGECHHDKNNKPINLQEGDPVDRCVVCHNETGQKPKDEKLTKKEMIKKYHKSAIHANCKGCHKKYNKTNSLNKGDEGAAPQDCKECHPKKK